MNYDVCHAESGAEAKLACELDKATVNIGGLFSKQVEGRVSTEVDPRLAYDTGEGWNDSMGAGHLLPWHACNHVLPATADACAQCMQRAL